MDEVQQKPPATGEGSGGPPAVSGVRRCSFWRWGPVIVLGTLALGALGYFGLGYLVESMTHESTDDAFLETNIVGVAPRVAGQVKKLYVTDNQAVKAGQLLLQIDPRDLQVALEQKRAALAAAKANVAALKANQELARAQVTSAEAAAKQSAAEVAAAKATAERAAADLKRAQDLIRNNTISPQEFDTAKAADAAAAANVRAAEERVASDQSKVGEAEAGLAASAKAFDRGEALVQQALADVQMAELNVSYARVTAPEEGRVTKRAVAEGDYVQIGQRLLALVPPYVWVTANFKETQLEHLRPGQPVRIKIDSLGGRSFAGHIDSVMAGSGARFSLLPPENAVGNYVKVVQRVPVKIVFNTPLDVAHVLGPGLSVVPSVHVSGFEIPEPVIIAVAIVTTLVVGMIWWLAARRRRLGL